MIELQQRVTGKDRLELVVATAPIQLTRWSISPRCRTARSRRRGRGWLDTRTTGEDCIRLVSRRFRNDPLAAGIAHPPPHRREHVFDGPLRGALKILTEPP